MINVDGAQAIHVTTGLLVEELAFLVDQARAELQTLQGGGNAVIHNVLLQSIGKGMAWRSVKLAMIAGEAVEVVSSSLVSISGV